MSVERSAVAVLVRAPAAVVDVVPATDPGGDSRVSPDATVTFVETAEGSRILYAGPGDAFARESVVDRYEANAVHVRYEANAVHVRVPDARESPAEIINFAPVHPDEGRTCP